MPLHDWAELSGWDGTLHLLWIAEFLRWVRPRLPEGYRAYVGHVPTLAVDAPGERRDLGVRRWREPPATALAVEPGMAVEEPDLEVAASPLTPPAASVFVEKQGYLVAAIELVSPRNKDRPSSRGATLARFLAYLLEGAHLLLVDVHRYPLTFSFADRIAQELQVTGAVPCPTPFAVSYRVGEPVGTGRFLALWQRGLAVGAPLPLLQLPLAVGLSVPIDLEQTYARSAADLYLP